MKNICLIILGIVISNLAFSQFSNIEFKDVFSTDSINAWVVGSNGTIVKISDGGQTVEDYSYNTDLSLNSIYFTNIQTGFIVGDSGLVLQTNDGGLSWNQIDLGDIRYFRSVSFVNEQSGWISTYFSQGAGLYKTINGGEDWDYIDSTVYHPFFIDPNNGWGKLWVGGPSIVGTNDGGNTWSYLSNFGGIWLHDIQFIDLMNGFYTTNDMGGGPKLYKTTNGGLNWTLASHDIYADILNLVDINNCWIGGRGGIYYSTDFFETWEQFTLPPNNQQNFIYSLSINGISNGWAAAYNYTTEKGEIWKLEGTNNWIQLNIVGINETIKKTTELNCYPNPSNNITTITFELKNQSEIGLSVFNINGQELLQIFKGEKGKGTHNFDLDCSSFSTGIYFIKLQTENGITTKKIVKM
ncbi:MAG: T9SS type A sorting domain-containing protein [Bacteroidales bacterium]|nr:T9SS type A sorting domain-containing protein [Bacteroidales bacterium]